MERITGDLRARASKITGGPLTSLGGGMSPPNQYAPLLKYIPALQAVLIFVTVVIMCITSLSFGYSWKKVMADFLVHFIGCGIVFVLACICFYFSPDKSESYIYVTSFGIAVLTILGMFIYWIVLLIQSSTIKESFTIKEKKKKKK